MYNQNIYCLYTVYILYFVVSVYSERSHSPRFHKPLTNTTGTHYLQRWISLFVLFYTFSLLIR